MAAAPLKPGTDTELRSLIEKIIDSISGTISSLVGRDINVEHGVLTVVDKSDLLASLTADFSVARGALDKDYDGRTMLTLIEVPDAVAMAGLLMMTPEDVIATRRKVDRLDTEDSEAFGELGNVLYLSLIHI